MDPRDADGGGIDTGIPRTRGDGPQIGRMVCAQNMDSPHARGWTRLGIRLHVVDAGFPARAGMDRPPIPTPAARCWIPRTRGDGPRSETPSTFAARDSPHARGWTHGLRPGRSPPRGFPARAGMDPTPSPRPSCPSGIPRTRGDGPPSAEVMVNPMSDSPHARGWTGSRPLSPRPARGFPARAGMDPLLPTSPMRRARIPRTRGDGPAQIARVDVNTMDSPHARGWTRSRRGRARTAIGFPARAGMDPRRETETARGCWIPRTRGDGPVYRGVIELRPGDSPHARGWTCPRRGRRPRGRGFPARAGMDPHVSVHGSVSIGIPRTRGDGPVPGQALGNEPADSPHARGWTPRGSSESSMHAGFPARAGMDLGPSR